MERRVVVTHLAGSSILLIHPGSEDPNTAAGRDGDLTGLISPKISGQYGALRPGPGRSPRTVLSTIPSGSAPGAPTIWPP